MPVTARFRGGSQDGVVMALPDARPTIEFPVYREPRWYTTDITAADTIMPLDTERYYASGRTISWDPATAASNNTVTIYVEYQAASDTTAYRSVTANGIVNDYYTVAADARTWDATAIQTAIQATWQPSFVAPSPEQQAAQARKWARQERRKVVAHKRARRLLLNLLSEQQQHEYAQSKCFTVVAKNGKTFRLRKGKTAELLGTDGAAIASYCIHLPYGYNHEDTLIALLLSLQTDPAEFERVANITQLQRPNLSSLAVSVRQMNAAMRDVGVAARHAAEHVRESRAILRAEGLSDAEVEALRDFPNHRDGLLVVGQQAA